MFAMDESASSFCAREMRGTLSIASTVVFFSANRFMRSGFCAGQMKETSVAPGRMSPTSSGEGARTLKTTSDLAHSDAASAAMSAPAARYVSSSKFAAAPAPLWTVTAKPSPISFWTTSGTVATRFSPAAVSAGTPITNGMFFPYATLRPPFLEFGRGTASVCIMPDRRISGKAWRVIAYTMAGHRLYVEGEPHLFLDGVEPGILAHRTEARVDGDRHKPVCALPD